MPRNKVHCRAAVVLETMWGNPGWAPGWFHINQQNYTGRRLHWLLGHEDFWVTNACPQQVANATQHGRPDPAWLAHNLQRRAYDLLLVCGRVAQATYAHCGYVPPCRVVYIAHPAARTWTRAQLDECQQLIQRGVH